MKIHCTAVGLFQSSINYTFLPFFIRSNFKSLLLDFKSFLLGGVANLSRVLSIFFVLESLGTMGTLTVASFLKK